MYSLKLLQCVMGCGQSQNKARVDNDDRITKSKRVDKKQSQPSNSSTNQTESSATSSRRIFQETLNKPIAQRNVMTNSQIEFFRMLDEKVEQGRDYEDVTN
ncbi:DgyrCDS10293 [Dimorphilus gyrociliatus]|uniref:DgyrCDS10293 n=1 Tax=Dimorphilus gyrociliatus TaxID=2664684 RepID=A0A7I8W4W3_9ANNE|nr:DgyrCDS10293 [Dimorphilus gyrociliatus]